MAKAIGGNLMRSIGIMLHDMVVLAGRLCSISNVP